MKIAMRHVDRSRVKRSEAVWRVYVWPKVEFGKLGYACAQFVVVGGWVGRMFDG
jgi:hypothetical protein